MTTRLMIVDDEPDNLELFSDIFEFDDIEILCCDSGDKALSMVEQFNPDVVLLDIMMPGTNGIGVCKKIKQNKKTEHIRVILITGLSGKEIENEGYNAGCDTFLNKPASLKVLRSEVFKE